MNPLFNQAEATVQGGVFLGVMTALFLVFFVGWALWAYNPARKDQMDEAARMPLDEGERA
jgi:cbb3-type cytochrome oxidase subunit 3